MCRDRGSPTSRPTCTTVNNHENQRVRDSLARCDLGRRTGGLQRSRRATVVYVYAVHDRASYMTARFAPADIGADLSALPENEREALGKLVQAARIMDASSCVRCGRATTRMLQELAARGRHRQQPAPRRRGSAPALLPDQQGTVVAAGSQRSRSCPARRRSLRAPTSIRRARRRKRFRSGSTR